MNSSPAPIRSSDPDDLAGVGVLVGSLSAVVTGGAILAVRGRHPRA